jgi:2'-hydroxyisoflavone reductase
MKLSRRHFLRLTAAATAALAVPRQAWAKQPLKILILGGTGFTGPHQVEVALGRGHQVTLFNRGKSAPGLFPQVENLTGDRDGDLSALEGRKWDAVIDNSGNIPRWVQTAAAVLKGNVGQYLYVSSISAYADQSVVGLKETAPLQTLDESQAEDVTSANYGGIKALCEKRTREAFPNTFTIARPGLIVGPGDPTDRFTYWPVRVHDGGTVLAPGRPTDPIQCIDARDVAQWMITALEDKHFGIYNLAGPRQPLTMGDFLDGVKGTVNSDCTFTWVGADFLQKNGITPWADMPLWVPPGSTIAGLTTIDITRAVKAGLTFRPMALTVQDSLAWHRAEPAERALKAGLTATREASLLREWAQSQRGE